MVFDVDQLKEALEQIGGPAGKSWGGDHFLVREDVVAAARLLVAGQPLWWCENHSSNGVGPRCDVAITYATGPDSCRMVEGWWMPTGKDET